MSKAKTVPCEACRGTGARALKPHEEGTLAVIPHRAWALTSMVHASLRGVKLTALANRLRDLRDSGLVERRKSANNPREYEWRKIT